MEDFFARGIRDAEAAQLADIRGNYSLGSRVLGTVAVIA